jgi:hypothetical protein
VVFKIKPLFSFALLALSCIQLPSLAKADAIVDVGNTEYDISTVTGSYSDVSASLMANPWWGQSVLAHSLSSSLADELGTPNSIGNENFAPLFIYSDHGQFYHGWAWELLIGDVLGDSAYDLESTTHTWAVGAVVGTPEPSTLVLILASLLSLGLLLGACKAAQRSFHLVPLCVPSTQLRLRRFLTTHVVMQR